MTHTLPLLRIHSSCISISLPERSTQQRGVRMLVAFLVWDQAVAGSSPVTSTEKDKPLIHNELAVFFLCVAFPWRMGQGSALGHSCVGRQNVIGPWPMQDVAPRAVSIAVAMLATSCTIHLRVSFLVMISLLSLRLSFILYHLSFQKDLISYPSRNRRCRRCCRSWWTP